jgi:probable HAF family extracellular repeat protein
MIRLAGSLLTLLMAELAVAVSASAGSYAFTAFDPPGSQLTVPTAINNRGQVVGYFLDQGALAHGFVWQAGSITVVDGPEPETSLFAVTENGVAVGSDGSHAFRYTIGDTTSGVLFPLANSFAESIDNHNDIVVNAAYRGPFQVGVLLERGVRYRLLPPDTTQSQVIAINNAGQVLGQATPAGEPLDEAPGFLYDLGTEHYDIIRNPSPSWHISFTALDEQGRVLGLWTKPKAVNVADGFVYDNGAFDIVRFPGAVYTMPVAMNGHGLLVGRILTPGTGILSGFLRLAAHYYPIQVSNNITEITGLAADDTLIGWYSDSFGNHGFIAVCTPDQQPCTQ